MVHQLYCTDERRQDGRHVQVMKLAAQNGFEGVLANELTGIAHNLVHRRAQIVNGHRYVNRLWGLSHNERRLSFCNVPMGVRGGML